MRSFLVRLLVAAVAIPALLLILAAGGWWLRGLLALFGLISAWEAWRLLRRRDIRIPLWTTIVLAVATPWWLTPLGILPWGVWLASLAVVAAIAAVWRGDPTAAALGAAAQITTVIWLGVGFGSWVAMRETVFTDGYRWLLFLFANLWIGDTAAYLFGMWLGKRPLAPAISPKKTVAGAVAQVITSLVIGIVFAAAGWVVAPDTFVIAAAVVIAIVGQIGDLFESILKRTAGCKDSSALIPGHGGILDRFDSALLAAPALWVMLQLFHGSLAR